MYDVVALGELLIDFACLSEDGEGYPTMAAHPGGAPANFLAALSRFGAKTALMGKVGNDAFGGMLLKTLENSGIDTKGIISAEDVFTTLAFVTFDENGDRSFSFARKPGADTRLSFDELDLSMISGTRVFHFGTLSLTDEPAADATRRAVAFAKEQGKLISFDPNLRKPLWSSLEKAKEAMEWGLKQADTVKISDEEVEFLWGLQPLQGAEKLLKEYGVRLVFVTCGAEGCLYMNAKSRGTVPALPGVKAIDTCGAGDIFGGSALWKMLQAGKAPEELEDAELKDVAQFASAAAGISVTRPGGISSVPDHDEVMKATEAFRGMDIT